VRWQNVLPENSLAMSALNCARSSLDAAAGDLSSITKDSPDRPEAFVVFCRSTAPNPSARRRVASALALGSPATHEATVPNNVGRH